MNKKLLLICGGVLVLALTAWLFLQPDKTKDSGSSVVSVNRDELSKIIPVAACDKLTPQVLLYFSSRKLKVSSNETPRIKENHLNSYCAFSDQNDSAFKISLESKTFTTKDQAVGLLSDKLELVKETSASFVLDPELSAGAYFDITTSFGNERRELNFMKEQTLYILSAENDKTDGDGISENMRAIALQIVK